MERSVQRLSNKGKDTNYRRMNFQKKIGPCAGVPKELKTSVAVSPLPEQPKEEKTTTTSSKVMTIDKQVNGEDGEMKVKDEKVVGDLAKLNSLGSLLMESEVAKESSVKDENTPKPTDKKPEEAKVSDETDAKQPIAAKEKSI
ncbi:hypothetical protein HAX54_052298 [Datura stramonium]|uniref:Uncharacterized protein n=1 Tax=Datura stramonium TaxID=4076 RepID=A0ABS8WQL9_DATST|nr:hypothetical protein [Datura stramonium]